MTMKHEFEKSDPINTKSKYKQKLTRVMLNLGANAMNFQDGLEEMESHLESLHLEFHGHGKQRIKNVNNFLWSALKDLRKDIKEFSELINELN